MKLKPQYDAILRAINSEPAWDAIMRAIDNEPVWDVELKDIARKTGLWQVVVYLRLKDLIFMGFVRKTEARRYALTSAGYDVLDGVETVTEELNG